MLPDETKLRSFAQRYTEAWCSHDPDRVAAQFDPHGSLAINDGVPAVGRRAISDAARGFMATFPDLKVSMDDLNVCADGATYRWTLTGTSTAGKRVRISGCEQWKIGADGLIAVSQGSFDSAEYQRQLE